MTETHPRNPNLDHYSAIPTSIIYLSSIDPSSLLDLFHIEIRTIMRCVLGHALTEVVKGKKEADGANSWKSISRLSLKSKLFLEPQLVDLHVSSSALSFGGQWFFKGSTLSRCFVNAQSSLEGPKREQSCGFLFISIQPSVVLVSDSDFLVAFDPMWPHSWPQETQIYR